MEYNRNENLNRNTAVTVGTSVVEIAADLYDNERIQISIVNISTAGQKVYLAIDEEAVASSGIPLNVGGSYSESEDAGYHPTQRRITAIADGAGALLAIHERVKV